MLTSKGLRSINSICRLPGRPLNPSRQFSSRHTLPSPKCRAQLSYTPRGPRIIGNGPNGSRLSTLVALPAAARFQSSASSTSTSAAGDLTGNDASSAIADLGSASLDKLSDMVVQVAPTVPFGQLGHLTSLGLDFGWGITSSIQWLLEHVQVYTGAPWWAAIIMTTVAVRSVLIRSAIKGSDATARMVALRPILKPIEEKQRLAAQTGDKQAILETRQEFMNTLRLGGVKMFNIYKPILWQMIFGISSFRLLRAMTALPVPSLETGGFLWMTDLTVADPYMILPASMALGLHLTLRLGGEQGVQQIPSKMRDAMMYGFPVLSFLCTGWLPGALQLSFATATIWGVTQGLVLRQPAVREYLGISPIIPPAEATPAAAETKPRLNMSPTYEPPASQRKVEVDEAPKGFLGGAKKELQGVVKEARDKMQFMTGRGDEKTVTTAGKTKSFIQQADAYEKRRKAEIEDSAAESKRGRTRNR